MTEIKDLAPPNVDRFRSRVLPIAVVFSALAIVGWVINPEQFYKSYLLAYMFWLGLTVGSLGLLMMQHMTGGAWGVIIRRNCEAITRLFPLMALLFVPLLVGMWKYKLYIWAQGPADWTPEQHEIIDQKAQYYLNIKFFVVRVVIYFAIWIIFSRLLNKYSREQDETGNRFLTKTFAKISGPGLVICGLMITFATIDWVMS